MFFPRGTKVKGIEVKAFFLRWQNKVKRKNLFNPQNEAKLTII